MEQDACADEYNSDIIDYVLTLEKWARMSWAGCSL